MGGLVEESLFLAGNRVLRADVERHVAAVRKLPGVQVGRGVVDAVFHVAAPFEHQRPEPFAAQFFGRPAAADARADHNGVVSGGFGRVDCKVCHEE
jgi:hypothetical protein